MARRFSRAGGRRRSGSGRRSRSYSSTRSRGRRLRSSRRAGSTVRLVIDTTGSQGMPVTPEALRQHLVSTMQQPVRGPRKASM